MLVKRHFYSIDTNIKIVVSNNTDGKYKIVIDNIFIADKNIVMSKNNTR